MQASKLNDTISEPDIDFITTGQWVSAVVGKTILLIDDEPKVTDICELMLKELGHTVIKAASGQEGLKLFEANKEKIERPNRFH